MTYQDYDRYQYQPWLIQVYRTLRYRPKWIIVSLWWIARWLLTDRQIPWFEGENGYRWQAQKTRWEFVKHLWTMGQSMTCIDTGHMHYLHEMIDDLRAELDDAPVESNSD